MTTDFRTGLAAAMADVRIAMDAPSLPPSAWSVLRSMLSEVDRARAKHGLSVEQGTNGDRCRILMAEVFEVSKAIDDIASAERGRQFASKHRPTNQLEYMRARVAETRAHLRAELTQVLATTWRWLVADEEASRG